MTREIMVKLTDRSYIIGTLVTLALVLGSMGAGAWFGERSTQWDLAVVGHQAESLGTAMSALVEGQDPDDELRLVTASSTAAAQDLVRKGDADALLQQVDGTWHLTFKDSTNTGLLTTAQQAVSAQVMAETAHKAGTTPDKLMAATQVGTDLLEGDTTRAQAGQVMALVFAVLFLMSALTYGMQIAQSVIEEKQSRIVEILVAAIPVRHLLAGKVLGNTIMALLQMGLLVGTGLLGASFIPTLRDFLPSMTQAVGWYLVLFLASFLALACIWAAAGAMGTRSEDLQHTSSPMIYLLMGVYFAGFMATGAWKVALSYVPIVSGVLMPARIVEGSAQWWDGLIALALNLLFAGITVWIGERIYRRALLQTQGRLSYREALKLRG
ncbi:ABC transporter permease [Luteococcus sp. Sow4_B9]|uniref:ABC transporter permease n=1 Tax=Luteococcus sp. Sow4_B9 TaxID=3438792 RepID=UPI003F9ADC24